MRFFYFILICSSALYQTAQISFSSPDSLYAYADRNSISTKVGAQQSLLAKWTKIAALGNSINFRNPLTFSATDNKLLPVNFIPGDFLGGPQGSVKPVT